jgi:hypothetical protein
MGSKFFILPNKSGKMISRVFPILEFTPKSADALIFYQIDLYEIVDILIYNHGYSAETLKSTLCYYPCESTTFPNVEFYAHKMVHLTNYLSQAVRSRSQYYAIYNKYRYNIPV